MNYKYEIVNYDKNIPAKFYIAIYRLIHIKPNFTGIVNRRLYMYLTVLESVLTTAMLWIFLPGNVKFLTAKMCIWFVLKWDIMRI